MKSLCQCSDGSVGDTDRAYNVWHSLILHILINSVNHRLWSYFLIQFWERIEVRIDSSVPLSQSKWDLSFIFVKISKSLQKAVQKSKKIV